MNALIDLIRQLERDCFYGRLEIQFRAGDIELVRKEQTIKLKGNNPNGLQNLTAK